MWDIQPALQHLSFPPWAPLPGTPHPGLALQHRAFPLLLTSAWSAQSRAQNRNRHPRRPQLEPLLPTRVEEAAGGGSVTKGPAAASGTQGRPHVNLGLRGKGLYYQGAGQVSPVTLMLTPPLGCWRLMAKCSSQKGQPRPLASYV